MAGTPAKATHEKLSKQAITNTPASRQESATNGGSINVTPTKSRIQSLKADLSARKKSSRQLFAHATEGLASDNDDYEDEDALARRILDGEDDGDDLDASQDDTVEVATSAAPKTPSKRGRGRPRGSRNKRTPTPPRHLPAYEHYFFQNRPGGIKTSDNTLSSLALLSHEDYYNTIKDHKDRHETEIGFLHSIHSGSFDQWCLELEESFSVCLYGWGSKYKLLMDFATHVSEAETPSTIVIVNGYNATLTPRDILATIASAIPSLVSTKLGAQPVDMVNSILSACGNEPEPPMITLVTHSIDSVALRRLPTQALLARLASSTYFQIIASADTPHFPLLWDSTLRSQFNWVFHDVTTFRSFDIELAAGGAGGVVDEVNTILGRSGRRMQGREGVMFVLKSLTESARNLFSLLIAELLSSDEEVEDGMVMVNEEEDEDDFETAISGEKPRHTGQQNPGAITATIPFRSLYAKAVEQLIATSELFFRELLKEFHDHQIIIVKKDAMGSEVLGVPFRREEAEMLLGELMGTGE